MRKVVRRQPSHDEEPRGLGFSLRSLRSLRPAEWFRGIVDYVGLGRTRRRLDPITTSSGLTYFLQSRSSFVAQTSLYGYLRTRAGMRYPELFDDDPFVEGINIAKWHIWLDCLSDVSVYAGGLMVRNSGASGEDVGELIQRLVGDILDETGVPQEAGAEFAAHAQRVRERLAACDWTAVEEDEWAFTESPAGLVKWSPVIDELKQLDEDIVKNSIRFRWQETRRDLRQCLDVEAVLSAVAGAGVRNAG